jgi:DNA topoisomerase IB
MAERQRRSRLRRSDCSGPGWQRRHRGRGFEYLDERDNRIDDPQALTRIGELAIPPAWREVWICADPLGHLQATGIDAAGRKQYLYHPRWREHRDRQKFERMTRFSRGLPKLRRRVSEDLSQAEFSRPRVLACAVRLLDLGMFRIGSEEYADDDGGVGLATLRREHVSVHNGNLAFEYPAKGGIPRVQVITDPITHDLLAALARRRSGRPELLAHREGRRWTPIRSEEVNQYLKDVLGEEFSAKDFRTWNATMMAAVVLATDGAEADAQRNRKRAVDRSVRAVAELLGNTPAVARRSYIDPRVFDHYQSGATIADTVRRLRDFDLADDRVRARLDRAVLKLLSGGSPRSRASRN